MKPKVKPQKPRKMISVDMWKSYSNLYNDKVPYKDFMKWVKASLPKNATNVSFTMEDVGDDYESYYDFRLCWNEMIENCNYEDEMKVHKRNLAKWQKENGK